MASRLRGTRPSALPYGSRKIILPCRRHRRPRALQLALRHGRDPGPPTALGTTHVLAAPEPVRGKSQQNGGWAEGRPAPSPLVVVPREHVALNEELNGKANGDDYDWDEARRHHAPPFRA